MQAPLLGLILSPQPLPVNRNELAQTQTDRRNPSLCSWEFAVNKKRVFLNCGTESMEWFNSLENHSSRFSDNRSTQSMQSNSFGAFVPTNSEKELVKESANAFFASSIVSDPFPSGFKVDVDMPTFFAKLAISKGSQELLLNFLQTENTHPGRFNLFSIDSCPVQRVSLLMISEHKDFKHPKLKENPYSLKVRPSFYLNRENQLLLHFAEIVLVLS